LFVCFKTRYEHKKCWWKDICSLNKEVELFFVKRMFNNIEYSVCNVSHKAEINQ
jgi:hypothetical protein